jgi:hypothetical protein
MKENPAVTLGDSGVFVEKATFHVEKYLDCVDKTWFYVDNPRFNVEKTWSCR